MSAVFDPETVLDRATCLDRRQYPLDIRHVIGVPVIPDGALNGAQPGRVFGEPVRPWATGRAGG